ncbi:unnamed protein product, partial [Hydatigera taeniaeformis]|uniref:Secreted protein n=1 Tax=Hydatigena taeniaeformis TaxID=6205 RepID=A0A0R3WV67_HYDTA
YLHTCIARTNFGIADHQPTVGDENQPTFIDKFVWRAVARGSSSCCSQRAARVADCRKLSLDELSFHSKVIKTADSNRMIRLPFGDGVPAVHQRSSVPRSRRFLDIFTYLLLACCVQLPESE